MGSKQRKFSLSDRLRSFLFALRGIIWAFTGEHNLWLQGIAALSVAVAGILLRFSRGEWLAVFIAIGMVLSAELFNTAIEKLADELIKDENPAVRRVKDTAAGAVLVASVTAAIIGALVILPKIF